jgi:hypothetical protein
MSPEEKRTWQMKMRVKSSTSFWLVFWAGVAVGIIPLPLALYGLLRIPPASTVEMVITFIPDFAVAAFVAALALGLLCVCFRPLRTLGKGILTGLLISTIGWHLAYIFLPVFFL